MEMLHCYFHEGDPRLSVFTLDSEDQLRWSSPTLTQSELNTPGLVELLNFSYKFICGSNSDVRTRQRLPHNLEDGAIH